MVNCNAVFFSYWMIYFFRIGELMPYIKRPLGNKLASAYSKVVILEGARAVGKTMLMKQELEPKGYSYFSLANESTYLLAKEDIGTWVKNLPRPAIIDEAQRISNLPLAVKEVVDGIDANSPQFILTGSASLNRRGLDGQNPLTRRSQNYELYPLTQREIRYMEGSIVDLLWDEKPNPKYQSTVTDQEIHALLSIGGFPKYAIDQKGISTNDRSRSIQSDINNTLGDSLLPGEKIDTTIANAILKELFTLPGNILNVARMASELNRDGRTIDRYINIFERRFLVRRLPNLALQAHKQTQSRPKIHPIDSSFSVEELKRAGKDVFGSNRTLLGSVLESYVVSQIAPEAQWSKKNPDLFYWRQAGKNPKEVDLVMATGNQLVGIEVKAARNFRPSDFSGLDALSDDPRFHRGFLVYMGERIVQHRENIWAIPITALWADDAFSSSEKSQLRQPPFLNNPAKEGRQMATPDASLFLSYRHSDNEYLGGKIVQLIKEIAKSYQFLYGETIDVFIDSESIKWGEKWETELDRRIDSCNVIMPAVTPGYIKSEACRKELLAFNSKISSRKNCRIMPLIWQKAENLNDSTDLVAEIITQHQYEDVSNLQGASPQTAEYRKCVEGLARRIHEAVVQSDKREAQSPEEKTVCMNAQEEGLLEILTKCQQEIPAFTEAFDQLANYFKVLVTALEHNPAPQNSEPKALLQWAMRFDTRTKNDVEEANRSIAKAEKAWKTMLPALTGYTDYVVAAKNLPGGKDQAYDALSQIISLRNTIQLPEDTTSISALISILPLISPKLKPFSGCFQNIFRLLKDIEGSISPLESKISKAIGRIENRND